MIYCIWYPGGGFGHFINAVLTLHGENFVRPTNQNFLFDSFGTSHQLELVAPKYWHDPETYSFNFDKNKTYSVLIDNGNENESTKFIKTFPNSEIIKISYTDWSWPIIAQTMLVKTTGLSFDSFLPLENNWSVNDNWAVREKYFLYLRDHSLRFKWKKQDLVHNLDIQDIVSYNQLKEKLKSFGIGTTNFLPLWTNWFNSNLIYIDPILKANTVLSALRENQVVDLTSITDIWTQAVIYYYIWLLYQVEVPHNDYSNWFTSTKDIVTMLDNHGVNVDTN